MQEIFNYVGLPLVKTPESFCWGVLLLDLPSVPVGGHWSPFFVLTWFGVECEVTSLMCFHHRSLAAILWTLCSCILNSLRVCSAVQKAGQCFDGEVTFNRITECSDGRC